MTILTCSICGDEWEEVDASSAHDNDICEACDDEMEPQERAEHRKRAASRHMQEALAAIPIIMALMAEVDKKG